MTNEFEHMKLDRQLCFLLYASSREMTKLYKPLLDELNITYPQYLALLLLWEHEILSVKKMGELLYLDSGTLTPMLKRMEQRGLITRERSPEDERSVIVKLTSSGAEMKERASCIPQTMLAQTNLPAEELERLTHALGSLLASMTKKNRK
ncbi:MarR family winged helix-turn-helix transcriptional regulator [Bacillus glycinifermentans]|uniref:MarR family winged helix-turn-helix transcriptional regulator n=1 Tax=Bacillus glycinifermentans TaxID=1664069 RepID=UPI001FF1120D|nr:MarR family transcriptional regulator [Bacillus glycinifermentans]MEC0493041.1 MarR family transcriptional regulator [Bacillus glycinifermentans]MEC0541341.1 MarR family transcriptional regulator [Bacillus glycinifermentans]MEC3606791.1 MarR family transcriptional regulator [Bacillus glycinifermentans]UOY88728.1 MarR family transcriptional regulator [Bacillus glycinifermentans]